VPGEVTHALRTQQRAWAGQLPNRGSLRALLLHEQRLNEQSAVVLTIVLTRPTGQCSTLEPHRETFAHEMGLDAGHK